MNDYYLIVADIINGIITFITFILCFINIYIFKKLNKYYKALSLYVMICFLFDFSNNILILYNYSNIGLLPLFNIIEVFLLVYFFSIKNIFNNYIKYILLIAVSINLYELVNYSLTTNYILNKGRIFNSLLFIIIILYILAKKIKELKHLKLFYIMLIYFSISFIQFLLLDFLINIPDDSIFITWIFYAISGGLLYLKATYCLWKNTRILNM